MPLTFYYNILELGEIETLKIIVYYATMEIIGHYRPWEIYYQPSVAECGCFPKVVIMASPELV
jgi:hypothetical protein